MTSRPEIWKVVTVRMMPGRATMPFNMTERDLDLIQLEELHSESGSADWFAGRIGLDGWRFVQARHSISHEANGSYGETDILVVFEKDMQRCAVMIEDKTAAAFTERQAERYLERGALLVTSGEVATYLTVLVAPEQYLVAVPDDAPWHVRIAVEEIAAWFARREGHHAEWRSRALHRMIERVKRSASPGTEDVARFSLAFASFLARHHAPNLRHNPGRDRSGPTIGFPGSNTSKTLWWKFSTSQMALQLMDEYAGQAELLALPPGVELERAQDHGRKCDYVVVAIPPVDPSQPFEEQTDVVDAAIEAAYQILQVVPLLDAAVEG